jgi:hypothetical protein
MLHQHCQRPRETTAPDLRSGEEEEGETTGVEEEVVEEEILTPMTTMLATMLITEAMQTEPTMPTAEAVADREVNRAVINQEGDLRVQEGAEDRQGVREAKATRRPQPTMTTMTTAAIAIHNLVEDEVDAEGPAEEVHAKKAITAVAEMASIAEAEGQEAEEFKAEGAPEEAEAMIEVEENREIRHPTMVTPRLIAPNKSRLKTSRHEVKRLTNRQTRAEITTESTTTRMLVTMATQKALKRPIRTTSQETSLRTTSLAIAIATTKSPLH